MKNRKRLVILIIILIAIFIFCGLIKRQINEKKYQNALTYLNKNDFENALFALKGLENYKDANSLKNEADNRQQYNLALNYFNKEDYKTAISGFEKIIEDDVSEELRTEIKAKICEAKYNLAIQYFNDKDYNRSKQLFLELDDYEKSQYYLAKINIAQKEESQKIIYDEACNLFKNREYKEALENFKNIIDYKDSKEKAKECKKQIKRRNLNNIVSAGIRYSAAILDKNVVKAVGDNDKKQCNVRKFKNMISIDAGGCLTIGLKAEGKIDVAGTYDEGFKIDTTEKKWNKEKFIDVAAGERFVVGLTENGHVIADGHGNDGQIDFRDWNKEKIIAIDAGWRFTVGLTENKELKFSGLYGNQLTDFKNNKQEWKDVVNISAAGGDTTEKQRGKGHTVGLKSNGKVVAIGDNSWGQCNVKGWKNIIKVVAGDWYTVGLNDNGQVLVTGKNRPNTRYIEEDVLEKANSKKDIVDIAAGYGQTILLHKNGSITSFGFDEEGKYSKTLKWKVSNPSY